MNSNRNRKSRVLLNSLAGLLRGQGVALQAAFKCYVASLHTHALVPCPPTTRAAWERLESLYRLAARHAAQDFSTPAAELQARLGLPTAHSQYYTLSIRFLWACLFGGRAYGTWLREDRETLFALGLRTSPRLPHPCPVAESPCGRGHLLSSLRPLGAVSLPRLWNSLAAQLHAISPANPALPLASLATLSLAIPALLPALPNDPLALFT